MRFDLAYLSVPLPEDVMKLKYYGDFERLNRVIDLKLQKDIPYALKQRLLLEKENIALWPRAYPHDEKEALHRLQECFGEFSKEELDRLRDEDAVEWAYINGEVHYKNNFLYNLIKTRPAFEKRRIHPPVPDADALKEQVLCGVIRKMKEEGRLSVFSMCGQR